MFTIAFYSLSSQVNVYTEIYGNTINDSGLWILLSFWQKKIEENRIRLEPKCRISREEEFTYWVDGKQIHFRGEDFEIFRKRWPNYRYAISYCLKISNLHGYVRVKRNSKKNRETINFGKSGIYGVSIRRRGPWGPVDRFLRTTEGACM